MGFYLICLDNLTKIGMKKILIILFTIYSFTSCESYSQDGWFWLNPLPQGNTYSDIEFTSNNTVYVSAAGSTLMKSTDGGNSFVIMTNRECGGSLIFINDVTGFSGSTNGILKTTNGGNNWRYISAPVDNVINFSTSPAVVLYGLKNNKVYLSNDFGESWNISLTALTNNSINTVHFPNNTTGYAGGKKFAVFNEARIYKTTNAGASWDTVPLISRYEVKNLFFINSNIGFAGTQNLILRTVNSGLSWDTVSNLQNQFQQFRFFDSNNGYLQGQQEIMITTNQGMNWLNVVTIHKAYLKNINEGLGIGTIYFGNFLYSTTNSGNNWITITGGYNDSFQDVCFLNEYTGYTGGKGKIYKTINGGLNWIVKNIDTVNFPHVDNIMFVNINTGFAGFESGKFARTSDGGLNWHYSQASNGDHLHGMSFPSADTGYVFTKYGHYLKTINSGLNWIEITHFIGENYQDVEFINNITGFAGGYSNSIDAGIIRKTTNGGLNWDLVILDSIMVVYDICKSNNNNWFAAGYDYPGNGIIYRSTNSGESWEYVKLSQNILSIHFSSYLTGYASAYNNITYKTTDEGNNWYPTYCINSNALEGLYFVNDNTGYGVGYNSQIIKTTTGGGVLINVEPQSYIVPYKFTLYQNYPNPFNPVTKIKFDIPNAINVSLKIYDILGREVSVVVNDFLIPGTYEFDFNGSSLSSGVYFYVFSSDDFYESKKMVLVK